MTPTADPPSGPSRVVRTGPLGITAMALPLLLGMLASLLLLLSTVGRRAEPWALLSAPGLREVSDAVQPYAAGLQCGATGLLCAAWLAGWRRARAQGVAISTTVVAALAWGLPLLLGLPLFSGDVSIYADQGYALAHGANPYEVGLARNDGPFAHFHRGGPWDGTTAVYGPLALRTSQLAWVLGGSTQYGTLLALKVLACLSIPVAMLVLADLARRYGIDPGRALWLGVLNPVILISLVASGHNEGQLMPWVLIAVWLAARRRYGWWVGAALIGVTLAIKPTAVMLIPTVALITQPATWAALGVGAHRLRAAGRTAGAGLIALAVGALTMLACGLGAGWVDALDVPGRVATPAPTWIIGTLAEDVGLAIPDLDRIVLVVAALLILIVVIWLAPRQPMACGVLVLLLLAGALTSLYPWYLVPALMLLPLVRMRTRLATGRLIGWAVALGLALTAGLVAFSNGLTDPRVTAVAVGLLTVALAQVPASWWSPAGAGRVTTAATEGARGG